MKKIKAILLGIGLLGGSFLAAQAVTCTNVFPTSLNSYVSGACIPSAWGNALEAKLGITGSAATSSLDYQINHLFTSYGSESITSSSVPWVNYSTASLPSSTWILSSTPEVNTFNGVTGTVTYGVTSANAFITVATSVSNATVTFSSSSLNLGSASSHSSTDYLPSSTVYVSGVNGLSGSVSLVAGNNISVTTGATSTQISAVNSSTAAGSNTQVQFNNGGTFGASASLTYNSSTYTLTVPNLSITTINGTTTTTGTILQFYNGKWNPGIQQTLATSSATVNNTTQNIATTTFPVGSPSSLYHFTATFSTTGSSGQTASATIYLSNATASTTLAVFGLPGNSGAWAGTVGGEIIMAGSVNAQFVYGGAVTTVNGSGLINTPFTSLASAFNFASTTTLNISIKTAGTSVPYLTTTTIEMIQ